MPAEIDDARPSSLSHLVGQKAVIAQVTTAIDAAFEDRSRFDHALLVGQSGPGEIATCQRHRPGDGDRFPRGSRAVDHQHRRPERLAAGSQGQGHYPYRRVPRTRQTATRRPCTWPWTSRASSSAAGGRRSRFPLRTSRLLLSTTDEYCLLQPLRDRMKLTLRFEFYTEEELALLLRHRCKALGWDVDDEVLPLIAQRSRGTPRLALRLLQACRRVCRSQGRPHDHGAAHFERACLVGTDRRPGPWADGAKVSFDPGRGTDPTERHRTILGLPTRTVAHVTEQFLIRAGLIDKDKSGMRQLTAKGLEHVRSK